MPRKKLIRQNEFPYHIVSRTNNRTPFPLPMYAVWDICKSSLIYAQERVPVEIHCLTLMNNHYHLLMTTPNSDIDKFMQVFNLKFSKLITKHTKLINQKFSNRYKWTIVHDQRYLQNVYRYIYQNPIRANIVDDCISYPYTSLHFTSFEANLLNFKPHFHYSYEVSFYEKRFDSNVLKTLRNALSKSYIKLANSATKYEKQELVRATLS